MRCVACNVDTFTIYFLSIELCWVHGSAVGVAVRADGPGGLCARAEQGALPATGVRLLSCSAHLPPCGHTRCSLHRSNNASAWLADSLLSLMSIWKP